MTSAIPNPAARQERYDAAALWHLRLMENPALEVSSDFLAWYSDWENQEALVKIRSAWQMSEDFAIEPAVLDMRAGALQRAGQAQRRRWYSPAFFRGAGLRSAAAIAAILLLCVVGGLQYLATASVAYATNIGERREFRLSDGSRVTLDSNSKLEVRYRNNARELWLRYGRAHFDVAHDTHRPFTVTAGNQTVVAVGTEFDVEKLGTKVLVTLIQGRIVVKSVGYEKVSERSAAPKPVSLVAGEQLVATNEVRPVIAPANVTVAGAWQQGRLVFNGDTLGEAVERINRYTDHPVAVDPSVASIRIIGSFDAGDVSGFISAVTSYFPVQATTNSDNSILLQPRAPRAG